MTCSEASNHRCGGRPVRQPWKNAGATGGDREGKKNSPHYTFRRRMLLKGKNGVGENIFRDSRTAPRGAGAERDKKKAGAQRTGLINVISFVRRTPAWRWSAQDPKAARVVRSLFISLRRLFSAPVYCSWTGGQVVIIEQRILSAIRAFDGRASVGARKDDNLFLRATWIRDFLGPGDNIRAVSGSFIWYG